MSAILSATDRDRLLKVLRLLGSDQIGERSAAAMMASRMVRDRGLDWEALLQPVGGLAYRSPTAQSTRAPATNDARRWHRQIFFLLDREESLTAWEVSFVRSAAVRGRLTPRQVEVLVQIHARVSGAEACQ
jgi:antibiotic biosynthesis monooxygenase (ABM) superfamily enzyme